MKKTAVYALALVAVGLSLALTPARAMAQSIRSVATDSVHQRVELSVKASSQLDAVKFGLSLENFQLDEQLEIRHSWPDRFVIVGNATGPISDLSGRLRLRNFIIGKTENGKTRTFPEHSLLTVELPPSLPKLYWKLEGISGSALEFQSSASGSTYSFWLGHAGASTINFVQTWQDDAVVLDRFSITINVTQ